MDRTKLDKWAELLLDTGKRNNLIHFRDTKASSAEVLLPSANLLLDKMDGAASLEVFDPKISEAEERTVSLPTPDALSEEAEEDARSAYFSKYSPKIKRQNQLLLYTASGNPIPVLRNIHKKAREFTEETGVQVAYMAFGFIHWREERDSDLVYRAPLLLVPIQFSQSSSISPYFIQPAQDDVLVNPTFSYKLETEYGIHLPEYDDEGLELYLEKVHTLVSPLHWTVTSECKIGIFSFLKINMYRDLQDNTEKILSNENVRLLLGEPVSKEPDAPAGDPVPEQNPLTGLHSVVDADSSQIQAIVMAKSGKSFVLQGPPGTGKSQTITNIIAESLSDGKTVLFVSEKLAALNVVYEKLKKNGLADFCLQLHSHKSNKKEVIDELCRTLRAEKSSVSSKASREVAQKERAMRQLDAYEEELHRQHPVLEQSLFQLYEDYAALRTAPEVDCPLEGIESKGASYLAEALPLLEQYAEYLPSIGTDYRRNPWYGFLPTETTLQNRSDLKHDLESASDFFRSLIPIGQEISEKYGISLVCLKEARLWSSFFEFAASSSLLSPTLLRADACEKARAELDGLRKLREELDASLARITASYDEDVLKLDGKEAHRQLTRRFTGAFSRVFSADYRRILGNLRLYRKDGKKLSYEQAVSDCALLSAHQEKSEEYSAAVESARASLGLTGIGPDSDWENLMAQADALRPFLSSLSFGALQSFADFSGEKEVFSGYAHRLRELLLSEGAKAAGRLCSCFDPAVLALACLPFSFAYTRLTVCLARLHQLDNWCHFSVLLRKLDHLELLPFLHAAAASSLLPEQMVPAFRRLFCLQWIDFLLSASPVLSSFNRVSQDKAVSTFAEKDTEQFEINKARIRAELSAKRPSLELIAPGSALALLLREGEKKRKQKSIRALLSEAGELIQRIKPCFLMSPLSVSTFLATDSVDFDLVIFDEASQIFPQDAIGAIYRGKQLIVVGDSRQMPPSNFFSTTVQAEDSEDEQEDSTDFESILDLCSTSLPQLRLRWHYRSRYEQLISFSNRNFYDGDLVTFPSSRADAPGIGVDYFHVDGLFDRKTHTNQKEAEFIVDLIYRNIETYPERSLGVVAFSIAQQNLIDRLLTRRRQVTPDKEFFFSQDAPQPFFIKNLETVQGDERDTILFSVAYGKDAEGKLLHNFGPLNRIGGERRLNVAVTRARCNVQLVSSLHGTDIDLTRAPSKGARLLRDYLTFAENGEPSQEAVTSDSPAEGANADLEKEICDFLSAEGFLTDRRIGSSAMKIDIGLHFPGSANYALALECDGASYHESGNTRDRDRLRKEILERMGWHYFRIWSTEWFRNRKVEQERLLRAAREAVSASERVPSVSFAPPAVFEEVASEKPFEFPLYRAADLEKFSRKYLPDHFQEMVREILRVEAPLSEDLLLKRMVRYFDREKVTSAVERAYEEKMEGCEQLGILRRNGFLYLKNGEPPCLRVPGDLSRDARQIAPEELAAGLLEILRQNVTADKSGLFRTLALQCGWTRAGKTATEAMEAALELIRDQIEVDGQQLTIR